MVRNFSRAIGGSFAAVLGLLAPLAHAGTPIYATIVYEPITHQTVPTLSEWGLIGMALLLAVIAYRLIRSHGGGKTLASVILAGVLGLGAMADLPWIRAAHAEGDGAVSFSDPAGGSVNVTQRGTTVGTNTSGVAQRIKSVNFTFVLASAKQDAPIDQCVAGMVLQPGASCSVNVYYPV